MHKAAIQKFAMQARTDLRQQVAHRADRYGITAEGVADPAGKALSPEEQAQRRQLAEEIRKKGYDQVMEEAAYTWFSRFIALRFLEVNGYFPSRVRLFSDSTGVFQPEILRDVTHLALPGLDMGKVKELMEKDQQEELYRYLLLTQCNALNDALPRMFEKAEGFVELLLPDNLLEPDSVPGKMVSMIPEADWTGQVQIIGWLYQHYHSQRKDETFALLKKNVKITKERLPFATQLFTPDWIVRYRVENSLGRLWIEGHPNAELKSGWKYYLDEAEQETEVQAELEKIRTECRTLTPQDIKVIDPCMGSGHILVYAFDVLVQIYKSCGYSERDTAKLILENNLYGLDIDDRAAQLAYFAVMMKARQYDRRIFSRDIQPNVFAVQESNRIDRGGADYFVNGDPKLKKALNTLMKELHDAKEYGSILNVSSVDFDALKNRIDAVFDEISMYRDMVLNQIRPLVQAAEVMARKYDVVVTNPPYMGASGMSAKLSKFVKDNYPDSKADLFAVFMERCSQMTAKNRYQAMITQHAWMFLSSYEKLRSKLMQTDTVNMAHLGPRAFEEIGGEVVQTTSFVMRRSHLTDYRGTYCRLIEPTTQQGKEDMLLAGKNRYTSQQSNFSQIPGAPVAYWVSDRFIETFNNHLLGDVATPKQGVATANNNYYLRQWFECEYDNINFTCKSHADAQTASAKWYPYNKGGEFRKWYGNNDYVVNWKHDGFALRHDKKAVIRNPDYFFQRCISWSLISSQATAFRFKPEGFIFDVAGMSCFAADNLYYLCGFCNTKVAYNYLKILAPTINFQVGDIAKLPVIIDKQHEAPVEALVKENIALSKKDWDAFETAWDFQCHPLINMIAKGGAFFDVGRIDLAECYMLWESECSERFSQLKANEEELNRIFIDIYGLQDELTPEVEDKDITVCRADLVREIKSLISYAVGCMFGRYSLNVEGLAYAGGDWDASKYKTYIPDRDNILPICDDDYFDDDIVARFVKWVETVYGKDTLEGNLKFIANALGGKGSPRQVIRNYFLNDFYADHLKIYQKRPIYWLFDSGKKNGFKALIYMHRYQSDLLARMRTDYVHEMQERYRTQLTHLSEAIAQASTSERVKLNKQLKKLQDQALELQKYEEKIHHLADRNISIDLDDGVKHNYALFGDVLAKIK